MTNLKINSKSEQTSATYTKDDYRVEITYNVNSEDNIIKDINMSVYNNANGGYICSVNANNNGNSELSYNINGIAQSKLTDVCTLIEEIKSAIVTNIETK